EPWSSTDVTDRLVQEGEDSRRERLGEALKSLHAAATEAWEKDAAFEVNKDAIPVLVAAGVSRDEARQVIHDPAGWDWSITGKGVKGDPHRLTPVRENPPQESANAKSSRQSQSDEGSIRAPLEAQGLQESAPEGPANDGGNDDSPIPAEPS